MQEGGQGWRKMWSRVGDMLASRCLSEIYMKLSNFQTKHLDLGFVNVQVVFTAIE